MCFSLRDPRKLSYFCLHQLTVEQLGCWENLCLMVVYGQKYLELFLEFPNSHPPHKYISKVTNRSSNSKRQGCILECLALCIYLRNTPRLLSQSVESLKVGKICLQYLCPSCCPRYPSQDPTSFLWPTSQPQYPHFLPILLKEAPRKETATASFILMSK